MSCPQPLQTAAIINGHRTEFIMTEFQDRFFIVVTQLDKLGAMVDARPSPSLDGGQTFNVKVVHGRRDDPLLLVYGRQLIENISIFSEKPLLLSIGLVDRSSSAFQAILNIILKALQLQMKKDTPVS